MNPRSPVKIAVSLTVKILFASLILVNKMFVFLCNYLILTALGASAGTQTQICTEMNKTKAIKCVENTDDFRIGGSHIYGRTLFTGDTQKVIHVWTVDGESVGQYSLQAKTIPWHAVTYTRLRTTPGPHDVHLDVFMPDGKKLESFHFTTGMYNNVHLARFVFDEKKVPENLSVVIAAETSPVEQKIAAPMEPHTPVNWPAFRAAGIAAIQSGYSSYSTMAQWAPAWTLTENFSVGPEAGITSFARDGGGQFVATELAALGVCHFNQKWAAGVSVGAQSWPVDGYGTSLMAGAEIRYSLPHAFMDYLFVGYRTVDNRAVTQETLAGVGLHF